jgi:hypothetical protein
MLTRREVLNELRRIGIKDPPLLKEYLEDFEHYLETSYGLKIATTEAQSEKKLSKRDSALVRYNQY